MAEDHPQRAAPLPVTAWRRLLINGPVVASALARPAQRSGIAARALVAAWVIGSSSAPGGTRHLMHEAGRRNKAGVLPGGMR